MEIVKGTERLRPTPSAKHHTQKEKNMKKQLSLLLAAGMTAGLLAGHQLHRNGFRSDLYRFGSHR